MSSSLRSLAGAAAAAVLLAACSSVPLEDKKAPVETRTPGGPGTGAGAGAGAGTGQSGVANVDLTKNQGAATAAPRVVYFDYDSFVVKDEYRSVIESNARALATNRQKKLVVEVHTDERGGREYNLALGQKRAESVVKSLTLLGAQESQLEAVSFGKERPAAQGSDEAAYAKNRRAELKDR
jgi:peptidoglycan-associated lipoprotein